MIYISTHINKVSGNERVLVQGQWSDHTASQKIKAQITSQRFKQFIITKANNRFGIQLSKTTHKS